jgi:hypothetical protein
MQQHVSLFCTLVLGTASLAAADAPYIGHWKFDPAKSHLTGETVTVEKMPDGTIRQEGNGLAFTFKLDGKEYPMPDGSTTSVKQVDAKTWDRVDRVNGKVTSTSRMSIDGDMVSITFHFTKPDGGTIDGSSKWKRVSGGPGFFGTFKSSEQNQPPTDMELLANGADGITLKFVDGTVCEAKFDGKDYPVTGAQAAGKIAYAFKKTGPRSFDMINKMAGKTYYLDKLSVSADGKTLTDVGTPTSKKEITTAVFDRQ